MTNAAMPILLVEDNEIDIQFVQRSFLKFHVLNSLEIARDGLEALAMLRGDQGHEKLNPMPKVILLDINMPKMNGIEFLKEVREDPELAWLNVFILTASKADEDILNAHRLNVAGYILKPVKFEAFARAIATLDLYWSLVEMPSG